MIKNTLGYIAVLLTFAVWSQTINIDNAKVTFEISNMKFNTVEGSFTGMEGEVSFDKNDLSHSKFDVCVKSNTINTGNDKRDEHLRKEDYFYVSQYPSICFTSSTITKTPEGYNTRGELSMRGVSKTVDIPFTVNDKTLVGNLVIDRKDFNIGEGTGYFLIGKEVSIRIECPLQ